MPSNTGPAFRPSSSGTCTRTCSLPLKSAEDLLQAACSYPALRTSARGRRSRGMTTEYARFTGNPSWTAVSCRHFPSSVIHSGSLWAKSRKHESMPRPFNLTSVRCRGWPANASPCFPHSCLCCSSPAKASRASQPLFLATTGRKLRHSPANSTGKHPTSQPCDADDPQHV